jgi:DNA-binding HxlR family transcriptional regulator
LWTACESGPSTFRGLQERCESISPAVLNQRLKELQAARLMEKPAQGYRATAMGRRVYRNLQPLGATARAWSRVLSRA